MKLSVVVCLKSILQNCRFNERSCFLSSLSRLHVLLSCQRRNINELLLILTAEEEEEEEEGVMTHRKDSDSSDPGHSSMF